MGKERFAAAEGHIQPRILEEEFSRKAVNACYRTSTSRRSMKGERKARSERTSKEKERESRQDNNNK